MDGIFLSLHFGKNKLNLFMTNKKFVFFRFIKLMAVVFLFIITIYHMLSNKWANYINQTLAVIKLATYSIIAIAGIYKLCSNLENRINWQQSLSGNTDVTAYSTSILMVSKYSIFFIP